MAENCRPGTPPNEWDVSGSGSAEIQGFTTDISAAAGQTVQFKINASSSAYHVDIYRMGWYGGNGARKVGTVRPLSAWSPQPACGGDAASGLVDCANWSVSARWQVPPGAVSGIYFAALVFDDDSSASHVPFVVRDDVGRSDLLFQTSDTTWQAYNQYDGNSLYAGGPGSGPNRAYKVSYNRPFTTRGNAPEDWVFNAEYPMVRWLERNGYDVSYSTGVDTDRRGAELLEHGTFLSVGHDEYWSGTQRANVEAARAAGVNLAFFSGNEVFWKTRWENGHRTLVAYKETHANAGIDPAAAWTGTWRDPRSFNAEGGRPENALTGTLFSINCCTTDLIVPAAEGRLRLWRGTGVAGLPTGGAATLGSDTIGYEWDEDVDNGFRPPGLLRLSSTTSSQPQKLTDYGSTYADGTANHALTLYRQANGEGPDSLVFGAGTVQWSWGLDDNHDRGNGAPSADMRQATVNLLADMGAQPRSLSDGSRPAAPSGDCLGPSSRPDARSVAVRAGVRAQVAGGAADAGGGRVGGVEVSVDGGASWHPTGGRERWSYSWTPAATRVVSVLSRAVDDSGHREGVAPCRGEPGGQAPGAAPPAGPRAARDRRAPRVRVGPRRVRLTKRGRLPLRVACPRGEIICRVDLKLRHRGKGIVHARTRVRGGRSRKLAPRVKRRVRIKVRRAGAIRVVVAGAARDSAGNRARLHGRLRVMRPKRRR